MVSVGVLRGLAGDLIVSYHCQDDDVDTVYKVLADVDWDMYSLYYTIIEDTDYLSDDDVFITESSEVDLVAMEIIQYRRKCNVRIFNTLHPDAPASLTTMTYYNMVSGMGHFDVIQDFVDTHIIPKRKL